MPENNNPTGNQQGGQGNNQGGQKPTLSWSQPVAANGNAKPAAPVAPAKTTPTSSAATQAQSNMGTYVGIFVAGLIIGALIGWGITTGKSGTPSGTASSTSMASTSGATNITSSTGSTASVDLSGSSAGSNSGVTVASPQTAGFAVTISKVSITQPTWLVVYEDHNGTPGNAIGAGLFFPGSTTGTVQLLRATLPGQSYFVGQSLDDGDKIFSLQNDKPVRDAQGNPLFTEFKAQ